MMLGNTMVNWVRRRYSQTLIRHLKMGLMVPSFFVWHGIVLVLTTRKLILVEGLWTDNVELLI